MIEFQFINRSDKRVIEALKGKESRVESEVRTTLNTLDARLQRRIQQRLEGEVLQSHTHKLVNSVRMIRARTSGNKVSGYVQAGGGVASYAVYQEKGAHIPEVTGKLMVFPGAERSALVEALGRTRVRQIMGRSGGMVFTMRHRAFDLPPRPFMAPSQAEMREEFIRELNAAISRGIKKK